MDSILTSIKKLLGINTSYTHFDVDIIMAINTALGTLNQLGVGPEEGFSIQDEYASWIDFLGDDPRLEIVKSYVHLKTRLLFDPPTNSTVMEAMNRSISELEFRITVTLDTIAAEEEEESQND